MKENKNKGFIKIILLIILVVIIGLWINSRNKEQINVETEQTKELQAITETSDSTKLEDLEADIDFDINLDDLDDLENTLDGL